MLKSEFSRRLRLHRLAEIYLLMQKSGIAIFRDEKPQIFSPEGSAVETIAFPAFYSSREIKELGLCLLYTSLTDEQKELAGNYAENLSLFLGDGLLQSLDSWTGNSIPSLGNVQFSDGVTEVIYYNQMDERYAKKPYGTDHIGSSGCGPTAMAMVVSSLSGTIVDPVEMSRWSYENGYWCKGSGSYHALIPAAAKHWNLPVSGCTSSEPQRILDALSEGKLVVAIMAKGHFTKSGHFIVLRGVENEKIKVADPGSYNRSGQLWDLSIILNEASRRAGAGGPFWIIG